MLWWLNHSGIIFPGTVISYFSPNSTIRYTSRVGTASTSITLNLERETWEEKSIWCDNLQCECKSINTFSFTPEHFISNGSPNFLPNCLQFRILKFSKFNICKVSKLYYFKKGIGTLRINFLNDFEFNKMQLFASILLIPSRSFWIFLRNLESLIRSQVIYQIW